MIKLKNNTLTRDPLPAFLQGLQPESLRDLSWTDPALGVSDSAWLPEVDQSAPLQQYQRYGAETLALSNNAVIVTRAVVPWTVAEIAADVKSRVPQQITMRQASIALELAELLVDVEMIVAALPRIYQIEWQRASVVLRDNPLVEMVRQQKAMTAEEIDLLFVTASTL